MAAPPAYDNYAYPPPGGANQPYPGYPPNQAYPPNQGYPPNTAYPPAGAAPPPAPSGYATRYNQQYPDPSKAYPPPTQPTSVPPTTFSASPSDVETGTEWAGDSFSDKAIRRAFIRKVYLILMTQLLFTLGCILAVVFTPGAHDFMADHSYIYYISYGTFLVTYITLVCCKSVRRKSPGNYICLIIFTMAFSYMAATISSFYDTQIVLIALGITAAVCLSITLFAIQTKIDFTMCYGLMFAACMVLFFFGWACLITYLTIGPSRILQCVYGAIAGLIFCLFLVYDTQRVVGGRKHDLSPEEYISGALQLYLDVVYLFLIILSFFGGKGK